MTVSPGLGTTATVFTGDASGSDDVEDPLGALAFRWDWDGDGAFDDTGVASTHSFAGPGRYQAWLAVDDSGGARDWASFDIIVLADGSADLIVVTTEADEADAGATPGAPGATGLSLREALAYADAQPGRQSILVPAGMLLTIASELYFGVGDVDVVGDGASLDGSGGSCLEIRASDVFFGGLELTGCDAGTFFIGSGSGNQLARLRLSGNGGGAGIYTSGTTIGPGNVFDGSPGARALDLSGVTSVYGNIFSNNAGAAILAGGNSGGSEIYDNVFYNNGAGIHLSAQSSDIVIAHNTIDSNGGEGLLCGGNAGGFDFRNNIVSRNTGWGLSCDDGDFSFRDHNAYFDNGLDHCSSCSGVYGASSLVDVDPAFVDPAGGDLRLDATSPLIDQGTDLGYDLNGPDPGLFGGAAPDIGAHEAP